jgi:Tfp pilus assembly protein PilF
MMGQLKVLSARDDYNFIIEKNPGNAEAYLGLARTYAIEDNYIKAFQFVDEALKRDVKQRDAYVLKALMFQDQNNFGQAISSYQTAVEIDPNFYDGFVALGTLHECIKDPLALDYFNTALDINPNGVDALYGKALFHQKNNEIALAQNLYRKIIDIEPEHVFAYYNQGYIKLVFESQYDSATYFFRTTVELAPNYLDAWYNLGLSERERGRNREAVVAHKEVLKIDPQFQNSIDEINEILGIK